MIKSVEEIFQITNQNDFISALSDRIWSKAEKIGFPNLSEAEQTVFLIVSLDGEVNNGGFDQFFFNSSGDYSHPTLLAVERIKANYTASLFRQALSVFQAGNPNPDLDQRRKEMDNFGDSEDEALSKLDEQYYEEQDNVTELLCDYVRSTKREFE